MVIARTVNETFPYIVKAEREQSARTTFYLRRLSSTVAMQLDQLHEASTTTGQVTLRVGDQRIVTLMAGLAGWDGLHDVAGKPVTFHSHPGDRVVFGIVLKNPAQREMIDLLPEDVAMELASAIKEGNTATADDLKN